MIFQYTRTTVVEHINSSDKTEIYFNKCYTSQYAQITNAN